MFLGPTASKSNACLVESAGVVTQMPSSQWRARRGHFPDIDLGIEIGREMLAMVAAIAVENVERVDRREMMLLEPGREDGRDARVEDPSRAAP